MDSTRAFIVSVERDYLLIRAIQFALQGLRRIQASSVNHPSATFMLDAEIESLTAALILLGGCFGSGANYE